MTDSIMRRATIAPPPPPTYREIVLATPGIQHYWVLAPTSLPGLEGDQCGGASLGYVGPLYGGGPAPMDAPGGQAVTFEGHSTAFLYSTVPETYLGSDPLSIEAWILIGSTGTTPGSVIELGNQETATTTVRSLVLQADPTDGHLSFYLWPGALGETVTMDTFHHLVLTSSGSLYVDGTLATSAAFAPFADSVGYYWRLGSGATGDFVGQLAHVAIYTTELSADTVAAHYAAGIA